MLALFGSLLGFGSSMIKPVMGYFEAKRDQQFELKMIEAQTKSQLEVGAMKLEAAALEAQARQTEVIHKNASRVTVKSSQWVINIAALVRPCIAFFMFFELMLLTLLLAFGHIDEVMYEIVWSPEMTSVFSCVISFYFGQRVWQKK